MDHDVVDTIVIYQCAECNKETHRKHKPYSLQDFKFMNNLLPNYYYIDAGTKEYFIIVRIICEECQT